MRRLQQEQRAGSDGRQCWLQQTQFTAARLRHEQLCKRTGGPAAARQFGGQRSVTARHHPVEAGGQLRRAPQGGVDVFGVTRQSAHGAIALYGYTVSSVALIPRKCKRGSQEAADGGFSSPRRRPGRGPAQPARHPWRTRVPLIRTHDDASTAGVAVPR